MECLPWKQRETIVYKLLIFRKCSTFQNLITAIGRIVKERMPDMLQVCSNLMCPPSFQHTFHEGHISESLQNMPMGDGIFSPPWVIGNMHDAPVLRGTF